MRRVLGIIVLLCAAAGVAVPAAQAATAPMPETLSIEGAYGTSEVRVVLPPGTRPVRFTGRIDSSYTSAGRFVISVNGAVRERVPTRGGRFRLPMRATDVIDGAVTVSLRVRLRPTRSCLIDDTSRATIRNPRMVLNRRPGKPVTINEFLSPAITTYVVSVPGAPSVQEQAAGLDAVLALRHRLGPTPRIVLRAGGRTPVPAPNRRVVIVDEDGSGSSSLAVRAGRMYVTGSPNEVTKAAISLADPNITALNARNVLNVAGTADYAPVDANTTLAGLGIPTIAVSGVGTMRTRATIAQAAFGEPVSQMIVNLRGAVTPARKNQQGRVSILWNDQLVASKALSRTSDVAFAFTIPATNLVSVNALTVEFQYLPPGGDCREPLPGLLEIDTTTSTVTATLGDSTAPGFQRFPQAFPATIPVGFRLRVGPALQNAARVLDAAASASPLQYTVEIMDKPGPRQGAVITGATPTQAQDLGAPLPNQQNLAMFAAGRSVPYAALQAFNTGGDDVIMLSAEPRRAARTLAGWPAEHQEGWADLRGQVYVKARASGAPEPFEVTDSGSSGQRSWLLIGAAVLGGGFVLLGLLWWWLRRR